MAVTRSPVDVAILLDLLFALAFDIHPMAHFKTIGPEPPLADVLNALQCSVTIAAIREPRSDLGLAWPCAATRANVANE